MSDTTSDSAQPKPGRSTGPRTEAGKARSKLNAMRHGLTGQVHITTEEDRIAYAKHLQDFIDDLRPSGAVQRHLVQTMADKQWHIHQGSAMLRSSQVVAQAELEDRIETEHPQVHAALTAGLAAVEYARHYELISRYMSRLQRDFHRALAELRTLQAEQQRRIERELPNAALLRQYHHMEEKPFHPADYEFVSQLSSIDAYLQRESNLHLAKIARECNFNREMFHANVRC